MLHKLVLLVLSLVLAACNMPATTAPSTNMNTVENRIVVAWENCVNNTGVFTHICLYTALDAFPEATPIRAGFTAPANLLILANAPEKDVFVVNGNQQAVEGVDYVQITGAQTGLTSVYLTLKPVTMRVDAKQIALSNANASALFPGWPQWPPVLPTPLVIATPAPVDPTATPTIIPAPFTFHGDFLTLWSQLTPDNNITMLLDRAYEKWGKWYGGEFTSVTYTRIPAGSIVWSTTASNIVDLGQQQFDPYGGCLSAVSTDETVIIVKCDAYVVEPPFKYLVFGDAKTMETAMLPAPPYGVYP